MCKLSYEDLEFNIICDYPRGIFFLPTKHYASFLVIRLTFTCSKRNPSIQTRDWQKLSTEHTALKLEEDEKVILVNEKNAKPIYAK